MKISHISVFAIVVIGIAILVLFPISEPQVAEEVEQGEEGDMQTNIPKTTPPEDILLHDVEPRISWSMKLVNEDVTDAELDSLKDLGISILSGEWGVNDASPKEVRVLLDKIEARNMQMVINFSDGSAWGFKEEGTDIDGDIPKWQKEKVQNYMRELGTHKAIYGYDISNEAGENLPGGNVVRIELSQMKEASDSVREIDNSKPIIMRMHYWDRFDGDFGVKNPFGVGIADIVMLNLYSNFTTDRKSALLPNMIENSGQTLVNKVKEVDPNVRIWIALGAFKELPNFIAPTEEGIRRDIKEALLIDGVENVGFFGWGPERYPDEGKGWYLPRDGESLLEIIGEFTAQNGIN